MTHCKQCCSYFTTSVKEWLTFGTVLLGVVLFIVGFATQYWSYSVNELGEESYYGLWRSCSTLAGAIFCTDTIDTGSYEAWLKVVQAFMTIALVLLFVGFVTMVVYIFAKDTKVVRFLTISMLLLGVIFIVVGLVVFGVEADQQTIDTLGFSFYFVVVSAFVILVGLILFILIDVNCADEDDE